MTDYPQLELLIGGEAIGAAARDTIEVLNPATGEAMAALPKATAADLDAATALAMGCPIRDDGGWVEVGEIVPM